MIVKTSPNFYHGFSTLKNTLFNYRKNRNNKKIEKKTLFVFEHKIGYTFKLDTIEENPIAEMIAEEEMNAEELENILFEKILNSKHVNFWRPDFDDEEYVYVK